MVLEKTLESPFWTARRFDPSILKEISPEYSLKGLMRKLKFQYFGHLMWRTDSIERPWLWERSKAGGWIETIHPGFMLEYLASCSKYFLLHKCRHTLIKSTIKLIKLLNWSFLLRKLPGSWHWEFSDWNGHLQAFKADVEGLADLPESLVSKVVCILSVFSKLYFSFNQVSFWNSLGFLQSF